MASPVVFRLPVDLASLSKRLRVMPDGNGALILGRASSPNRFSPSAQHLAGEHA